MNIESMHDDVSAHQQLKLYARKVARLENALSDAHEQLEVKSVQIAFLREQASLTKSPAVSPRPAAAPIDTTALRNENQRQVKAMKEQHEKECRQLAEQQRNLECERDAARGERDRYLARVRELEAEKREAEAEKQWLANARKDAVVLQQDRVLLREQLAEAQARVKELEEANKRLEQQSGDMQQAMMTLSEQIEQMAVPID
eukprot:TRINITY_DN9978_c0_g1_i1.p2 TRINITY_DN9978_c0_g1~~TRINITY_DN9978_c0_g1_i1.p2  ORF type:complete len:202 (+),score=33.58 TRINITY_DN9978_c0_g1_i1:88-693(+)